MEKHDLRTTHVDLPGDDLWVRKPDGSMVCVQVKSSARPLHHNLPSSTLRYGFKLNHRQVDKAYEGVFIFVATDVDICIARTWDDIPPISYKIDPEFFTRENQTTTIRKEFKL